MKVTTKLVKVLLESPDGNAVITMKAMAYNVQLKVISDIEALKASADAGIATLKDLYGAVFAQIISVEGLEHEDGSPVTVEQIRNLELPQELIIAIHTGYFAALNPPEEKKTSSADESPSA